MIHYFFLFPILYFVILTVTATLLKTCIDRDDFQPEPYKQGYAIALMLLSCALTVYQLRLL